MEEVRDPFANLDPGAPGKVEAHNLEKMDHAHSKSTPPPINYELVIRRLAEIEDEIKSRGIEELLKEKEALRTAIKDAMIRAGIDREYDETSNFEAVLVRRTKDMWDVLVLKSLLSASQKKRYIVETVNEVVVKAGVKTGDLSRADLEAKGAVTKGSTSLALYVKEREEGEDGVRV